MNFVIEIEFIQNRNHWINFIYRTKHSCAHIQGNNQILNSIIGRFNKLSPKIIKINFPTSFASNYTFAMSIGGGVGYLLNPSFSLRLIPSYKYFLKTPFEKRNDFFKSATWNLY